MFQIHHYMHCTLWRNKKTELSGKRAIFGKKAELSGKRAKRILHLRFSGKYDLQKKKKKLLLKIANIFQTPHELSFQWSSQNIWDFRILKIEILTILFSYS